MELYYYRGEQPNFGDELNCWLMPRVFPGLLDGCKGRHLLLAIGSVLFDHHPHERMKIVFGSGYGGYTAVPRLDQSWDVRCVRGPRTANALGIPCGMVAGDSAILVREHYRGEGDKRYRASFMPHFQSLDRGRWQIICRYAGLHFIDPRDPPEVTLAAISQSRVVITEAMHGAIVADALRVPWVAMRPLDKRHHMKWLDWAEALKINLRFHDLAPSTTKELSFALAQSRKRGWRAGTLARHRALDKIIAARAVWALSLAARVEPQLSRDAAIDAAAEKLNASAAGILADYATGALEHAT